MCTATVFAPGKFSIGVEIIAARYGARVIRTTDKGTDLVVAALLAWNLQHDLNALAATRTTE